jgi:threonine aldolase
VYQEDYITTEFQKEVARLTEMEDALFMLSGTEGNQFSLATPYSRKVRCGG